MRSSRAATVAATTAASIIAQQIASKATRDTLFLTSFDATRLPEVMLAAAGIALIGVGLLSRLLARLGPTKLVPALFLASAALYSVEAAIQPRMPGPVAYAVYLHVALFGSVVVSGFWSVVNERFDPHAAKRYIGRIAAGATAGGVVGGLAAERTAALFGPGRLLVVLAALNVLSAFGVAALARGAVGATAEGPLQNGFDVLRRSPFLRRIAGVVVLLAFGGALLDFSLKAEADARYAGGEGLASFFALYYTSIGIATFVVQTLASQKSLERMGIGRTLSVLPAAILALGVLAASLTRLVTVVALRGTATVLENSVFRSGYELLYTPVAPRRKRPTKMIIDVAGNRLGDALGSGVVMLLLLVVVPEVSVRVSLGLAVVASAGALMLIAHLQRGYVSQLADSLRTGAVVLDEDLAVDATTRQTLAETTMALDRSKLLAEIAEHRKKQSERPGPPPSRPHIAPVPDARTIPEILPLLATDDSARASRSLRRAARRHLGQLVDALLDPEQPVAVRRRLPPIVAVAADERAARGLRLALDDPRFEVRYRSGQALSSLCARHPELAPPRAEVLAITEREVQVGRKVWESQRLVEDGEDEETEGFASVLRERRDRSLEHVFNLLSLTLEREPLRLALQALHSERRELRGTALEYLENVLPESIRRGLWPYVAGGGKPPRSRRPSHEVVDELLRSMDSLRIDRRELMEGVKARSERPPAPGDASEGGASTGEDAAPDEAASEDATGHEAASEDATGHEAASEDAPGHEAASEDAPGHEAASEDAPGDDAPGDDAPDEEEPGAEPRADR